MRFSLKNATQDYSLIRVRISLNVNRLTIYLPPDYKISPNHWDKEAGKADITDLISVMETKGGIRKEQTYEKCELEYLF